MRLIERLEIEHPQVSGPVLESPLMSRRGWLLSVIGWDGCLPVLLPFSLVLLRLVLPNRDIAEIASVLLVPMAAALIRTQQGYRQIAQRFGRATFGRQFLLGCAITMLLIFEIGFTGAVMANQKLSPSSWLLAACYYFTYLGLIVAALKPRRFAEA